MLFSLTMDLMFQFHVYRCNILKKAPFDACNKHINPESHINACISTLCKYPAADGLNCQFLEAYARACSQHSNITVEGWRADTSCCKPTFNIFGYFLSWPSGLEFSSTLWNSEICFYGWMDKSIDLHICNITTIALLTNCPSFKLEVKYLKLMTCDSQCFD